MNFEVDAEGYVPLGDVARGLLGMQCQYASHYVNGLGDLPRLADEFRFKNLDGASYHEIRIHQDDVEAFVQRMRGLRSRS